MKKSIDVDQFKEVIESAAGKLYQISEEMQNFGKGLKPFFGTDVNLATLLIDQGHRDVFSNVPELQMQRPQRYDREGDKYIRVLLQGSKDVNLEFNSEEAEYLFMDRLLLLKLPADGDAQRFHVVY